MNPEARPRGMAHMTANQQDRCRAAAEYALHRYPGPVGELIRRELCAYVEFGHRFTTDALIPHLVTQVLTPPGASPHVGASTPEPPRAAPAPAPRRGSVGRPRTSRAAGGASRTCAPTSGVRTLPPGFALWPHPTRGSWSRRRTRQDASDEEEG